MCVCIFWGFFSSSKTLGGLGAHFGRLHLLGAGRGAFGTFGWTAGPVFEREGEEFLFVLREVDLF